MRPVDIALLLGEARFRFLATRAPLHRLRDVKPIFLVVVCAVAGCSRSSFLDCEVTCSAESGCPDGFACIGGFCRGDGAFGSCDAVLDARPPVDARDQEPDASIPDAPLGPITLQETADNTIAADNSITCRSAADGANTDQTWFRAFALADFAITGPFRVTKVDFGIQESAGTPSVVVQVGTYGGAVGATTLDPSRITPLASRSVVIPATTTGEMVDVPITANIPANGKLAVSIIAPDLRGTSPAKRVFIGASKGGETQPGYITAVACGITPLAMRPIDVDPVSFPMVDLIITVTGERM